MFPARDMVGGRGEDRGREGAWPAAVDAPLTQNSLLFICCSLM